MLGDAYDPSKSTQFNRYLIESKREKLLQCLTKAYKLLLIGINYRKEDPYINKIIETAYLSGAQIGFVGSTGAFNGYVEHCNAIKKPNSPEQIVQVGDRFQNSIYLIKDFIVGR